MKQRVANFLASFGRDERGATAIEYAIIASMIAGVLVAAVATIGTGLAGTFNNIATKLNAI